MKFLLCVAVLFFARTACCVTVVPGEALYVASGSTARLTCSADWEVGVQRVTWWKGDIGSAIPVRHLNDSRISTSNDSLTINNFHNSEHGGLYSCSVEDPQQHKQLSCPVELRHARIKADASSQVVNKVISVVENGTAVLVCGTPASWPSANIHWERDGQRIEHEHDSRMWMLPSGNLYIIGVQQHDGDGVYRCSALNPVTNVTRRSQLTYSLSVTEALPVNATLPSFSVEPVNTVAVVGDEALLECSGHAHPEPVLEWIIIHRVQFPREAQVLPTGALRFVGVTREDAGVYRCLLRNSLGSVHVDVTLEVRELPSLTFTPTNALIELPRSSEDFASSNRTAITCTATGSFPLGLVLLHNGNMLSSRTVYNSSTEASLSHIVVEEGYYQCFATNDLGCAQWTTFATRVLPETEAPTNSPTTRQATTLAPTSEATSQAVTNGSVSEAATTSGPVSEMATTDLLDGTLMTEGTSPPSFETTPPSSETLPSSTPLTTGTLAPSSSTTPPSSTALPLPAPVLDIMTNGDRFDVTLGSELTLECHVSGGGEGTKVSWYFNEKLLKTEEREGGDGGPPLLVSKLMIESVELGHAGEYFCKANSTSHSQTVTATFTLVVSKTLHAPIDLSLVVEGGRAFHVSWHPNPLNQGLAVGYKIAWDHPSRISHTAVDSVPVSATHYLISPVDLSSKYTVLVWAYLMEGDGVPAQVSWLPQTTPTTTAALPLECVATVIGPSEVLIVNEVGMGGASITATCLDSQTASVTPVTMETSSILLNDLLPECHYQFSVGGVSCHADTPPGQVALNESVHRLGNSSIQLDWHLPRELRDSRELVIEINLNGEWIPVRYDGSTPHIQAHLDKHFEHRVQFRLRLGKWVGFGDITIPAAPLSLSPTTSTSSDETVTSDDDLSDRKLFQLNEVGLIYGLIFGLLVVACSVVVITILVLKYIQMTRRDSDKVSDDREKHREEFRRLSLKRSSVNSLNKEPKSFESKQTDV